MFELIHVGEKSFYINSPAKIGVYKASENEVYLIDSGNDKEAGRRIRKILDENNWILKGIINTHSNADHIGGNHYLQQQTGCKIFSSGIETAFTKYPILESAFLYGGFPCKDLRHKFLLASGSDTVDITDADFPKELEIIPLPGHFFDMIAIRTPDDTIFLADCISSKNTLDKYGITFIYDVEQYLQTLDKIETLNANIFVPAHTEASSDLKELIQFNKNKVLEIADRITKVCTSPINFEKVLQEMFRQYNLSMSFEQYVLVGSTVRSYLSWLYDKEKLTVLFEDNQLLWKSI